jgi:hypothetical protein
MRILRSLFFCIAFAASAVAATPPAPAQPFIQSVVPALGPSSGGTTVTITGGFFGLPTGFACLLPCPPRVFFGETLTAIEKETDTVLVVKTSPHPAGGVEVKVVTGDGRSVTARDGFLYADTAEAAYERMLLPIYLESRVGGADGTFWETNLWLRNNSANGVTLAPWPCPRGALCIPVFPLTRTLQPGETLQNLPEIVQANPGRVLFVNKDGAADLSAGLRLYEVSHSDTDAGTETPVVRESALLARTAHLHNVPLNGRFRIMLRIYDLAAEESRFRVRVYEEAAGVSNASPLTELELTATSTETGTFRFHPAYAEYGALSNLLWSPAPIVFPRPSALRIDVEPLTAGSRYWAFVSITNNETQRVTLVTPQ